MMVDLLVVTATGNQLVKTGTGSILLVLSCWCYHQQDILTNKIYAHESVTQTHPRYTPFDCVSVRAFPGSRSCGFNPNGPCKGGYR